MSRITKFGAAALITALALPGVVAAEGDATVGSASFDALEVTSEAGTITIVGSASFGGEELTIGEDASTDGAVPGLGTDLLAMRVVQDPGSGTLEFHLDTDLAAPATTPGLAWTFDLAGSSLPSAKLVAFSTDEAGAPASFQFGIATGGGINEDFGIASLAGRVDGSTLVWSAAPSQVGLDAGSTLSLGAGATSTYGLSASGLSLLAAAAFDTAAQTAKFGIGGGAKASLLDASGEIVDDAVGRVRKGEFTINFDGVSPGAYTVEVTTVYADAEVTKTFPVTVA